MSKPHQVSRRQFLQTAGAVAGGVAAASLASRLRGATAAPAAPAPGGFSVAINPNNGAIASSPAGQWAISFLRQALADKGIHADAPAQLTINLLQDSGASAVNGPEAFALVPAFSSFGQTLAVHHRDAQGLIYALTEIADRVRLSENPRTALTFPAPIIEKPANPYRGIVRTFFSENEDKPWFYDREGWQKYFDMLVTHRFNHFNLSFGLSYDFSTNLTDVYTFFLYPFMVNVPGYKVRAIAKGGAPLPEEEQKKNLDTLKFISDQAALRGLNFTLGIWTQNYRWTNSPNATYTIEGLDAQTQAPYCRDAMKMLIDACPGITGINLRTHGESGIPEGSYDLWKIIMSGMVGHKNPDGTPRILELDLHGKTMTQEMIDTAATTGMPLIISCKHAAEHMGLPYIQAAIRESEMPKADTNGLMALSSGSRNFLRYGIGDLIRKDRNYKIIHRVWPGTQHLLLWGDPLYAAEFGRMGGFAGTEGIDFFEPLSFRGRAGSSLNKPPEPDRTGYVDAALRPKYEWEKYLYTLRLWGRLSYNPDAQPENWQPQLQSDFSTQARPQEAALANASRILPLITSAHLPAAASGLYWPEMYTNQSIHNANNNTYSEAPNPKVFGNVSPLDPQIFATVNQFVDSLLTGKPDARISPLEVARQLDTWSEAARRALTNAAKIDELMITGAQRRAEIDVPIAAGIGQFFAHKFRTAILWQLFNLSGHEPARAAALDAYKKAREAWAKLADTAKVYGPNQPYGGRTLSGHWADRLPAIDTDIAGMTTAQPLLSNTDYPRETIDKLIAQITNPIRTLEERNAREHTPPTTFKPNQPLALQIGTACDAVRLCYRHVHQGQRYATLEMTKAGTTFTGAIPAEYTNSPFPLQYYFELHTASSAAMHPGFQDNFTGTPYFVVMPA